LILLCIDEIQSSWGLRYIKVGSQKAEQSR